MYPCFSIVVTHHYRFYSFHVCLNSARICIPTTNDSPSLPPVFSPSLESHLLRLLPLGPSASLGPLRLSVTRPLFPPSTYPTIRSVTFTSLGSFSVSSTRHRRPSTVDHCPTTTNGRPPSTRSQTLSQTSCRAPCRRSRTGPRCTHSQSAKSEPKKRRLVTTYAPAPDPTPTSSTAIDAVLDKTATHHTQPPPGRLAPQPPP